jgi:hypothetical protein
LRIGKDERSTSNVQRLTSNEEKHHQIFFIQRSMLEVECSMFIFFENNGCWDKTKTEVRKQYIGTYFAALDVSGQNHETV